MAIGLAVKATILGVFGVGTGQAALGRPRRGALWLGAELTAAVLFALTPWAGLAALAIFIAALVDTFLVGFRAKPDTVFDWLSMPVLAIFATALVASLLLRWQLIESFKIPASSMYPTLEIGDHIVINKLVGGEPGDVIVFRYPCDPDRDYVKRVIAKGGDTVEVRCNVVYVNGKAIPNQLAGGDCTYSDYDEHDGRWFERHCSRYRETLGSHAYDVFHDSERPERDKRAAVGDARDFPHRNSSFPPSCSQSEDFPPAHEAPAKGQIVETKPEQSATACEPQLHYVVPPDHVFVLGDNRNNSNDSRIWGGVPTDFIKGRVVGIWATNRPGDGWSLGRVGAID